jgi:hypothetical protein
MVAPPPDPSWNNAPPLLQIAATQQGGARGAQVFGVTNGNALFTTYQETPGGNWSSWFAPGWPNGPASCLQVAACQQNDGRCQLFVTDEEEELWTIWQTSPGGDWSSWAGPSWNGAPLFTTLAASQQGGTRGAQLWGIDEENVLWTCYQSTPGGAWSSFEKWPGTLLVTDVAAAQQGDGRVQLFAIDQQQQLWSAWQTSPGGGWTGWSGPNWNGATQMQGVAACQLGGGLGAQVWGLDQVNNLWSTSQTSAGGNWTSWVGPNWNGAKEPFMQMAAAQQNDGRAELWGIDMNLAVKTTWQTAPGGSWTSWQP